MIARTGRLAPSLLALWIATGCIVNRPDPRARVYTCETGSDCLAGWVCADMSVLGGDVCRPACDPERAASTCPDGFCTSSGACFDTCLIESDGDIAVPCPGALTCIRRSAESGAGLCLAAEGCSATSECTGENRDCLNEVFGLPASVAGTTLQTDRVYCVDTPQGEEMDRCLPGSFAAGTTACIPSCDQEDDRCPPILTCLRGLGTLYGATGRSACLVGVAGMPCTDDSGCFEGRCLPVAGGRRACTFSCEDAARLSPAGCDAFDGHPLGGLGGFDFACDPSETCDRIGTVGAPCNADLPCHAELTCSNNGAGVCTKECEVDEDCRIGVANQRLRSEVYCALISDGSPLGFRFCLSQRPNGSACAEARECVSGRCSGRVCQPGFPSP